MVVEDAETGYVGGDVEDLVRELVHRADGDGGVHARLLRRFIAGGVDLAAAAARARMASSRLLRTTAVRLPPRRRKSLPLGVRRRAARIA